MVTTRFTLNFDARHSAMSPPIENPTIDTFGYFSCRLLNSLLANEIHLFQLKLSKSSIAVPCPGSKIHATG